MASHPPILGHISIGVRNIDISETFYTAVFAALGLKRIYKSAPGSNGLPTLGYGPEPDHEIVNIFEYGDEARPPGKGCHIAFNATTRRAVEDFHEAAGRSGGSSNGSPGVREHYGANYFAAFVVDPDGWRLEAVCKAKEE